MKSFNVKINVDLCKKNVGFSFLLDDGRLSIVVGLKWKNSAKSHIIKFHKVRKHIFLDFKANMTSPRARRGFIFRSGT